ncbi:MAG TPA: rhomboid family intramembrane serine protease [Candidatus Limnocylindrales bacterium]
MDPTALDTARTSQGPLPGQVAQALVDRGRQRLDEGEPHEALADFRRVLGNDDAAITAAGWLGAGDALYRLDAEADALAAWEAVVKLPQTPSTYRAWRNIAGARVREGDLAGATTAYRQADRLAPPEDRAEIASRLGWLAKESGNSRAAGRYFARSRGSGLPIGLALAVLGITVVVSLVAILQPTDDLYRLLWLDRADVRAGQLYRLLTVTLLHADYLHLGFNMYALYLIGPIVESTWGSKLFAAFYVLTALAASTASVIFTAGPAVGASGAIFGLIGVLYAGTRAHHPVLDKRARAVVPQLGFFILLNLGFGFASGGTIDNAAHIGGLLAGLWLGFVVPPGRVPTLRSAWQHPAGQPASASPVLIMAGVVALIGVIALGLAVGGAGI